MNKENLLKDLESKNICIWLDNQKIKTEDGKLIDFYNHQYLGDIFNDGTPKQVCLKAAQICFTVTAMIKSLYIAKHKRMNIIYCVDKETEILTRRGFLKQDDLNIQDEVLSIDEQAKAHGSPIYEIFRKEVDMDMYYFDQRNFNACATGNHRGLVKNNGNDYYFRTTEEILKHYYYIPKIANLEYEDKESINDDLVVLLSGVFAEGTYVKQKGIKDNSVIITQSKKNKDNCELIKNTLRNLKSGWKEYYRPLSNCYNYRFAFELGKYIKETFPDKQPTYEWINKLSPRQAKLFIDNFIKADGGVDKLGTLAITQKNREMSDKLCMLATIAGYAPSLVKPSVKGCYTIRMTRYDFIHTGELRPTVNNYKGIIGCPRTKYGTFYARRNGRCYGTGNTLPTEGDVNDMVSSKVNGIINNNKCIQDGVKDKDSIQQKRVGDRTIYYRGTKTERAALAVSSDLNIHDEEDRSDQQVIAQYSSRLQHSDYKGEWHFSNPSVKGNGVDRYGELSDQKHGFIKCPHCNEGQYLSGPESIDMEKEIYICKECGGELSDDNRRKGKGVKKYKDREGSGYGISLLMAPGVSAKDIVNYYKTKPIGYFYNFVLGLPEPSSTVSQVDPEMIYKNCFQFINNQSRPVIGVDIGTTIHYVIGNTEGLFYFNKTKIFDDLEKLLFRFKDAIMVIDAGPDIFRVRDLREKFKGRVFLCHFARDRKTMQLIRWGKDAEFGNVLADRNRMIQIVVDEFNDERITLQGTREDGKEYYSHGETMYRTTEIDKLGSPVYEGLSTTGSDHGCLATIYGRIGMDKFSEMGEIFKNSHSSKSIPIAPTVNYDGKIENIALIKQSRKKNDGRKC